MLLLLCVSNQAFGSPGFWITITKVAYKHWREREQDAAVKKNKIPIEEEEEEEQEAKEEEQEGKKGYIQIYVSIYI